MSSLNLLVRYRSSLFKPLVLGPLNAWSGSHVGPGLLQYSGTLFHSVSDVCLSAKP